MNPTDSEKSFLTRKLRTLWAQLDKNEDGYISTEDFELMAKRANELTKATGEQAESCRRALAFAAEMLGYKPGVKLLREDAVRNMVERISTVPWEEQRKMCYAGHNYFFDAFDTNHDDYISAEEFEVYFQVFAPGGSEADKIRAFNLIDANNDGKISREEFLEATFEYLHGVKETELSKVFFGPLLP